jgi:hypothetical protein
VEKIAPHEPLGEQFMRMKMGAIACVALLWSQVAVAQTVNLQGCPANKGEVSALLRQLKVKSETQNGTQSYGAESVRFFGDPVLGIYEGRYSDAWLHIRLSRPRTVYMPAMKARYAKDAQRDHCGDGYESCYMRMKEGAYGGLHSFDFSNFIGRLAKEGEPDGNYLVCYY